MSNKLYRKVGKRYKEVGVDFEGFPANGIWLVQDGKYNCIVKLGDIPDTPKYYPLLAGVIDDVAIALQEQLDNGNSLSSYAIAELVLKIYAEKLDKQKV